MTNFFIVAGAIGAIVSILRRGVDASGSSFWSIINNDFWFDRYATIPLISFIYALIQGSAYGSIVASILSELAFASKKIQQDYSWCESRGMARCDTENLFLHILLFSVASLIAARVLMEAYIIIYKAGQVFIDSFREYEELADNSNSEYGDFNE